MIVTRKATETSDATSYKVAKVITNLETGAVIPEETDTAKRLRRWERDDRSEELKRRFQ